MELLEHTWPCPVCGTESEQRFVGASSELPSGPPSLETRPHRDTLDSPLPYGVWRCPECGYAEGPVVHLEEREPLGDYIGALVRSDAYRAQLADESLPELARSWLCRAMVEAAEGRLARAGWSARASRFEEARARGHRALSGRAEEPFVSLLEFELELVNGEDTAAHHAGEVVGPW